MNGSELAIERMVTSKFAFVTHADEFYPALRNKKFNNNEVNYTDHVICENLEYITLRGSFTKFAMMMKKGSYLADFFNSRYISLIRRILFILSH